MNFEKIKALQARVKAQAAVALDAAQTISNFDNMAAEDDYIHSEDLRTPGSKPSSTMLRHQEEQRNVSAAHSRSQSPAAMVSRSQSPVIPVRSQPVPMAARSRPNPQERVNSQQILMEATRFSAISVDYGGGGGSDDGAMATTKKNPKRFLEDLDQRIAMTEEGNDRVERTPVSHQEAAVAPQWNNWIAAKSPVMANMLSKLQSPPPATRTSEMEPMVGPLSARRAQEEKRKRQQQQQQQQQLEEDEEPIQMVTGNNFLGAEEQAQLEKLKLASNSDPIADVTAMLNKHRDFAFIAFTMLLASGVYFYTRHKEEIDDV